MINGKLWKNATEDERVEWARNGGSYYFRGTISNGRIFGILQDNSNVHDPSKILGYEIASNKVVRSSNGELVCMRATVSVEDGDPSYVILTVTEKYDCPK